MASWHDLEIAVREAANTIWGHQFKSLLIHGRQIDAYCDLDERYSVAIEVTEKKDINKIQEDLNKLIHVRNTNFSTTYRQTRCICVLAYEPTVAMKSVRQATNIEVMGISDFKLLFLPFDAYHAARSKASFGSAIDPLTGAKDTTNYVSVSFLSESNNDIGVSDLIRQVDAGQVIVLTGEYGTGKSKCIEHVYEKLASSAWETGRFPLAIDLRKCWGLKDRYEIINRHFKDLNIPNFSESFIKAYNSNIITLLLDGFDEMGVQLWSDDANALQTLRSDALAGVRDLISNQNGRILVSGRNHYFDGNEEMVAALGLASSSVSMLRSKDEFTLEEITEFMSVNGREGEIPEWLPRKPLTFDFFLRVLRDAAPSLTDNIDLVSFWELLINAVCEREARIHSSFDVATIKKILIEVAAITRSKPDNVGPLTLTEIQNAFERVVGHAPIDQASVLLQRLPGLGRASADSEDRRFVDTYMLDGLRALNVLDIVERAETRQWSDNWFNPLSENGLLICGRKLEVLSLAENAISACKSNIKSKNQTLGLDIVCSLLVSGRVELNFAGVFVEGGHASICDFSHSRVSGLQIVASVLERVVISGGTCDNVSLKNNQIGVLEGISSQDAIPDWMKDNTTKIFSSIATTSRIRAANLLPAQKVLVTVLRKTFYQRGAGRKEEALLRGLGTLVRAGMLDKILAKLLSENILSKVKGDEGNLWVPVRSQKTRIGKILAELSLSKDPIWYFVSSL